MIDFDNDRRFTKRLRRFRRHARWILGGTLLCALAAALISLILPHIYRATTYVMVSESKIGPAVPTPSYQFALISTYVPFVDNDEFIARAIKRFHLDQAPYDLTVYQFRKKDYLDVQTPKATRLIEISVEFPDARLAADIANYLAATAVELNRELNSADTATTQKFLEERVKTAAAQLDAADARRLEVREHAKIEDKERSLAILLDEKERATRELQQLNLALTQSESRAQALEKALSQEPRTVQLKKSIDSNRFLERAAEKGRLDDEPALSTTEEALNATHSELSQQWAGVKADAAAQQAGVRAAQTALKEINTGTNQLIRQVTRLRNEIDEAERDFAMARETYEASSRDYRNASVTVSAKSQDLKQIAPAQVPERPVRPRFILNVLLATLLGAVILSAIAMTMENLREISELPDVAVEEEVVGARRS